MSELCDLGCGNPARYYFNSGKKFCSSHHNKCPEVKKKKIESNRKARNTYPIKVETNELCSYGCGNIAKYRFKSGNLCCCERSHLCPKIREKNSENSKGKPSGMLGKTHSEETRKILSEASKGNEPWSKGLTKDDDERLMLLSINQSGKTLTNDHRRNISNGLKNSQKHKDTMNSKEFSELMSRINTGKKMSEESRRRLSESLRNSKKRKQIQQSQEYKDKMSRSTSGSKNGNYKGLDGTWSCYDTDKDSLEPIEETKRDSENGNILNVKCTICGNWFRPTRIQVMNRAIGLENDSCRFYCSDQCKNQCDIFGQMKYPKWFSKNLTQEVDHSLREMVLERDDYECQICESELQLHCHHIDPKNLNPLFANDMDSCITLCKECHIYVHTQIDGCKYHELRCD